MILGLDGNVIGEFATGTLWISELNDFILHWTLNKKVHKE